MYGLVNRAIEDLAISLGGEPLWEAIAAAAGFEDLSFVSMESYDDELTYRLVAAAAEKLNLPAESVLDAFGEHWVTYTGRNGYGAMMQAYGHDTATFLRNLNSMHARVRISMPELRPPDFDVESRGPDTYAVHYRSHREGLAPMVTGLLRGLGILFGESVEVQHIVRRPQDGDHDVFLVTVLAPAERAAVESEISVGGPTG